MLIAARKLAMCTCSILKCVDTAVIDVQQCGSDDGNEREPFPNPREQSRCKIFEAVNPFLFQMQLSEP